MKMKLISVFLITLMISGFLTLFITIDTPLKDRGVLPSETMQISAFDSIWHHDCSNLTGFGDPIADIFSTGSMTSNGNYIYADSIGTGSGWHGPA
jgi:hypothetical protein